MPFRSTLVLAVGLLLLPDRSAAQASSPKQLQSPQVLQAANVVRSFATLGLSPEFTIEGERTFDGPVLLADQIVFHPGSRLVFTGSETFSGDKGERYVGARTIRVLPGEPPPVITWARGDSSRSSPISVGKAAPGSMGNVEGADGGPGEDGRAGNPGYPGRSAPTIYVFVDRMYGGTLRIDLRGQDGGLGGPGQAGGDGGLGRSGRAGVPGLVDCRSGGGNGGNGGRGGMGGPGGPGGRGGNGGTVILVSTQPALKTVQASLRVDVSAGAGGPTGPPGPPGQGGLAGQGGSGGGLCQGGQAGLSSQAGPPGVPGEPGPEGIPGAFAVTPFTKQQLSRALGFGGQGAN